MNHQMSARDNGGNVGATNADDEAKGNDDAGEGALDSILKPARGTLLRMPTMSSPMATRRASIHLSDLHSKLAPLGMEHIASNVDKWCDHLLSIGPEELALNLVDKAVPVDLGASASAYASAIKVFRDMLFEGVEHTDAELRKIIMDQSKSKNEVEQTIVDLVSWSQQCAISQDIEGAALNQGYVALREMESEILERIKTRIDDTDRGAMIDALEGGVVGSLPDKHWELCAGIKGMKALCEIYDKADRLVLAQRNDDRLRGEMKELGVTQQAIVSIADQIKFINREISKFNKAGDKASQKAEREKRATIKRVDSPKADQELILKREVICGPARAWSRPINGNGGENSGGEGKGEQGNDGEEQVKC